MKIRDIIVLAFESLAISKFRSFLSILGITIGVAAVISGVILGVGNRELIMQKLAEQGTDALWFYTKPKSTGFASLENLVYQPDLSITKEDVQYIKNQCSAITEAAPLLYLPSLLYYGGKFHTVKSIGFMLPNSAKDVFRVKTIKGRFLTDFDVEKREKVCVIERSSFSKEIFGGEIPVGQTIKIGWDKYKIVGSVHDFVFSFSYPARLMVFFPATTLQESVGTQNYNVVYLRAKSFPEVPKARYQLQQAIVQRFGYPSKLYISEYGAYLQTALEIVNLLTFIVIGIAVISLSVGGVGIMNVMMTMVTEQTREIGISKAIGAKNGAILYLFIFESVILTLIGGILGILIGLGASKLVTFWVGIPLIVPAWVIILGFSLSFIVGIISGSYPAKRAAELDPAVTLRQL